MSPLGTSKIERVKAALGAMEIHLRREEWYEIMASEQ